MATAIRTIGHEDRLSLVDHLDELRTRLIVSALALAVSFGICFWQNHNLLRVINHPLTHQTQKQVAKGQGPLGQAAVADQAILKIATENEAILRKLAQPGTGLSSGARAALLGELPRLHAAVARVPRTPTGDKPVTLGVGEPFTTTVTISFYFALIFALPILLWQLYAFVLPAFTPFERRVALPVMLAVPWLFVLGVAFGYVVVLPAAVHFLQNFNSSEFNVLVQASQYYKFAAITLLAMGLVFQVPIAVLAATRAGLVTPAQLRKNRRYAILVAAVIAALLPADLVTMLLEMAPLVVLFELSILLASVIDRRAQRQAAPAAAAPEPSPPAPDDVQDIIDHIDHDLH